MPGGRSDRSRRPLQDTPGGLFSVATKKVHWRHNGRCRWRWIQNRATFPRMLIVGLGTAAPRQCYAQKECWEALQQATQFGDLNPRSRAILKKILTGQNGIVTRHLALDELTEVFDLNPDTLQARFIKNAPALAAQAAERALADAGCQPEQIDALIISTCTGYLCPGLTSYVGERLRLRADVLGLDLVGQGCGAAIPNLRVSEALLSSGRCRRVLSICVEVCSAAFFLDDDPGVLVSACLFGDGAGAAVLADEANGKRRVEWKTSCSILNPGGRDLLRFEHKQGMLRNILTPDVPALAAQHVAQLLDQVLTRRSVKRVDIKGWILHPGGRDVLLALQQRLGLSESDLRWSTAILEEFGNLSSASLFFVLQAALADSAPSGHWWMSSFGAGFSGHGTLLEVE
jgi:alkylresorcinol/alkylpyrone synthase